MFITLCVTSTIASKNLNKQFDRSVS